MFTYTHIRKSLKKNNFISAGFPKNHSFVRRPLGLLCIVIKTGSRVLASVMLIGSCHLMLSAQLIIFNRPINSLSIIFKCCLETALHTPQVTKGDSSCKILGTPFCSKLVRIQVRKDHQQISILRSHYVKVSKTDIFTKLVLHLP